MAEQVRKQLDCEHSRPNEDFSLTSSNTLDPIIHDALHDAKNRIVALRIEQTILALLKTPEATATSNVILSNPFHRLVAHKVGDYYKVGHRSIKDGILLYKTWETADSRPPRLTTLVSTPASPSSHVNGAKSPGGTFVLKRNISQNSVNTLPTTGSDTQIQSNTNELGENPSILDDKLMEVSAHEKLALRKAQYEEARQRIFEDQSEDNASDDYNSDNEISTNDTQEWDPSYYRS